MLRAIDGFGCKGISTASATASLLTYAVQFAIP